MADIICVADYILGKTGAIPTMKLQKLAYYSQAYHLVKHGTVLFNNEIQAWANGPVIVDLFEKHRGMFIISKGNLTLNGDLCRLSDSEKSCINRVIEKLGGLTGNQLSELTHSEEPWRSQRIGLSDGERSSRIIKPEAIKSFYSSSRCHNPLFV